MKPVLRAQDLYGFVQVPPDQIPHVLSIRQLGSEERYEFPLQWDAIGVAETIWPIPNGGKPGNYQVMLVRKSPPHRQNSGAVEREWVSGELRVEDFHLPLMRGILSPPAVPQIGVSELPVDPAVQYLTGRGTGRLPAIPRAHSGRKNASLPANFGGVMFANGRVNEGLKRSGLGIEGKDTSTLTSAKGMLHHRLELNLDVTGMARAMITELPQADMPVDLLLEQEYPDPNGEV